MSMQYEPINLYIRPDNGPVSVMMLDMLDVETSVIHTDVNSNRDNTRVNEIIARIKRAFPNVQPEASRQQLRVLISRLSSISIYDGIVLRMPGTINGPALQQSYGAEEVERLTEEVNKQRNEAQVHKQKYNAYVVEVEKLTDENKALRTAHQNALEERNTAQADRKNAENQAAKALQDVDKLNKRIEKLEQEQAELRIELDQERHKLITAQQDQAQVAKLRMQLTDAKDTERRLRDSLATLEQENEELNRRIRELTNEAARMKASAGKPDGAKGLYLD